TFPGFVPGARAGPVADSPAMTPTRHSGFDVMQAGQLKQLRAKRWAMPRYMTGLGMLGSSASAFAQSADPVAWQLNMGRGVTTLSNPAHERHMRALWICVGSGVAVFAAMAYAILAYRKSKGAVAATWRHNTTAEAIWTIIPVLLL